MLTSGGLLFLCICTVLHACFAKPFFEPIPNTTVEEAYVHVHKIANELEMYANYVQLALNCDARGMDLVRATPILVPLKLRLRVIFLRMHRRWLHYTKSYRARRSHLHPRVERVAKAPLGVHSCRECIC